MTSRSTELGIGRLSSRATADTMLEYVFALRGRWLVVQGWRRPMYMAVRSAEERAAAIGLNVIRIPFAVGDGLGSTARPAGMSFASPRWVRSAS